MRPVIERGYLYIAQPPLYKVKRGQSEMYLKNQVAFDDYILQTATEKLRLLGPGHGEEISGTRLAALMRRVQIFEQLLGRLGRRRNDTRVLRQAALVQGLMLPLLQDERQTRALLQALQETLQQSHGDMVNAGRIEWDEEHGYYRVVIITQENGATLTTAIDHVLLASQDFRDLRALARQLDSLGTPPFTLQNGNIEFTADNFNALLATVSTVGKKDLNIQRYKGLGEMNPIQLWETTMDPERRTLLQVTIEDAVEADYMFTTLMGDQVDPRKAFIEQHAKEVVNLDV